MIFLVTDFGGNDIYVGQMKASLLKVAPGARIVDLFHNAPNFDVIPAAHLLAALAPQLAGSVTLAVVDAGVGGARRAVVLQADDAWFVGPDNGLLSIVAARAKNCRFWEIVWRPENPSHSFHGRDLFAPIAAMLDSGEWWPGALEEVPGLDVNLGAADCCQVIYIDHYGNAITGQRAAMLSGETVIAIKGRTLRNARVFSEVPRETQFWYENSIGLVEVAVNCGSAAEELDLRLGTPLHLAMPDDPEED